MELSQSLIDQASKLKNRSDPKLLANVLGASYGESFASSYFHNKNENIKNKQETKQPEYKYKTIDSALYAKVIPNKEFNIRKGDGISLILARIFNLIKDTYDLERKQREIENNFSKEKSDQREKWNHEILDAIKNIKFEGKVSKVKKEDTGIISNLLSSALKWMKDLWNKVKSIAKNFFKVAIASALASLAAWASKFLGKSESNKIEENGKKAIESTEDKVKSEEKLAKDKIGKMGEATKAGTTAEKMVAKTASKSIPKTAIEATKTLGKIGYSATKSALKIVPVAAAGLSLYSAKERLDEGDYTGSLIDTASAGLGLLGPLSFGASLGIDAYQYSRDKGYVKKNTGTETLDKFFGGVDSMLGIDRNYSQQLEKPKMTDTLSQFSTPIPTKPDNSVGKVMQERTRENNSIKTEKKNKTVVIDNSKKTSIPGSSGEILMDSSAPVRIDDPTLKKVQKQSLRPT